MLFYTIFRLNSLNIPNIEKFLPPSFGHNQDLMVRHGSGQIQKGSTLPEMVFFLPVMPSARFVLHFAKTLLRPNSLATTAYSDHLRRQGKMSSL
jgi:hypothetical protein